MQPEAALSPPCHFCHTLAGVLAGLQAARQEDGHVGAVQEVLCLPTAGVGHERHDAVAGDGLPVKKHTESRRFRFRFRG